MHQRFIVHPLTELCMFTQAIIFTKRNNVKDLLRAELKPTGVEDIQLPSSAEQCLRDLRKKADALLVLDWELGVKDVTKVLNNLRAKHKIEVRPILLISPQVSDNILSIAVEYGILQVLVGDMSRITVKHALDNMKKEFNATQGIRAKLAEVAELRTNDKWHDATGVLEGLIEDHPGNAKITAELAENLMMEDHWDRAVALLKPYTNQEPINVRVLHLYGRCLMKLRKFTEASVAFERAKLINPYNVERLVYLGNVLLQLDRVEKAHENFDEALTLEKDNPAATVGKGKCLLLEGEVNEALALLKDVSGPRELGSIFNNAAILSMRNNRFNEGISLYNSAIKAVNKDLPTLARLYFNIGIGYKRFKQLAKAIEFIKKSKDTDPSFGRAAEILALLTGDTSTAAKKATKAVKPADKKVQPDFKDVAEDIGEAAPNERFSFDMEEDFEDEPIIKTKLSI